MQENSFIALGTAGGKPSRLRSLSGSLLNVSGETWLINPGEGALRSLIYLAINPSSINCIHLSRVDAESCLGLPALLNSLGPAGSEALFLSYPAARQAEVNALRQLCNDGCFPSNTLALTGDHEVKKTSMNNTLCFRSADSATPSYGIRIENESGPVVAMLADGRPCTAASLLMEKTTFCVAPTRYLNKHIASAKREKLMTASEAATLAKDSDANFLKLTGFSAKYELPNGFLHEASEIFPACDYAQDLQVSSFR